MRFQREAKAAKYRPLTEWHRHKIAYQPADVAVTPYHNTPVRFRETNGEENDRYGGQKYRSPAVKEIRKDSL